MWIREVWDSGRLSLVLLESLLAPRDVVSLDHDYSPHTDPDSSPAANCPYRVPTWPSQPVRNPDNPKQEPIMVAKLSLTAMLVLAMTPVTGLAQVSSLDEPLPESVAAHQPTADQNEVSDPGPFVSALKIPGEYGELSALSLPSADEPIPGDETMAAPPAAAGKGSGTGLGFMIAGGAALVGGLLIGGTGGNLIAAGGVALGVYGIIVYF